MVCVCCSPRPALVAHRGMVGSPGRESPNPGSPTLRAIADPNDFLKGTSPYRDAMKAVPKDQQSPRIPPPLPGEPDLQADTAAAFCHADWLRSGGGAHAVLLRLFWRPIG